MKNNITNIKYMIFAMVGLILTIALWQYPEILGMTFGASLAVTPFVSITKESGCNMAGIATIAYVIPLADIETFPTLAAPSSPEDLVTYINSFVLKANKYWHTIYSTKEMGELLSESDGPTDGKFFRNKATLFHPRTTAKALGMMTLFKDTDSIIILKEFGGGGQMRVIGNNDIPATIFGSENSGKGYGDEKGITFSVEAADCTPAKIYTGDIITETTVLNAPVRMAVDATSIDYATGSRFVVGANTVAKSLTTIDNMLPGDVLRIEFDASSTGSLAFAGAYGATALIDADTEWFEITKDTNNQYVITGGLFS